jgi:hypothetical protein
MVNYNNNPSKKGNHGPAQVVRSPNEPMQVRLVTKPLTKFACRWAESRIAGMNLMVLVTLDIMSAGRDSGA